MSDQKHETCPLEEIITLPKAEYDRLMVLSKAMRGVDDPKAFIVNVKELLSLCNLEDSHCRLVIKDDVKERLKLDLFPKVTK